MGTARDWMACWCMIRGQCSLCALSVRGQMGLYAVADTDTGEVGLAVLLVDCRPSSASLPRRLTKTGIDFESPETFIQ